MDFSNITSHVAIILFLYFYFLTALCDFTFCSPSDAVINVKYVEFPSVNSTRDEITCLLSNQTHIIYNTFPTLTHVILVRMYTIFDSFLLPRTLYQQRGEMILSYSNLIMEINKKKINSISNRGIKLRISAIAGTRTKTFC
jgi:hypothetical protein